MPANVNSPHMQEVENLLNELQAIHAKAVETVSPDSRLVKIADQIGSMIRAYRPGYQGAKLGPKVKTSFSTTPPGAYGPGKNEAISPPAAREIEQPAAADTGKDETGGENKPLSLAQIIELYPTQDDLATLTQEELLEIASREGVSLGRASTPPTIAGKILKHFQDNQA